MPAEARTVAGLGEAGLLELVLPRLRVGEALLGPGDDAALVAAPDGRFVITADTLVEDQDFRLRWPSGYESTGFDVGWKSAAQNLSDVNAMGAEASAAVVSLTLPPRTPVDWVLGFADGFAAACVGLGATRCSVAGGDLGTGREISVTTTVTGDLAGRRPVLRSGARPGDVLVVTGSPGRAAAGLSLLESAVPAAGWNDDEAGLAASQLRPAPPLALGPAAAVAGATAMMDLSDGIARDAPRLARASGVDLVLDADVLGDLGAGLRGLAARHGRDVLDWVVGGGEDFGLLACFPPGAVADGFTVIGRAAEGRGTVRGIPGAHRGWDHFE
ncbi:thiamine-phosphate kinase [Zafaria sp. J156]|uniref:thiamine-phosphate kinase n=1 Tax=Zafaria sp. J156 TaxID=3116490 RepID=UPI002E7763BD|nr:thiamine-phosphate kinase [Zafaria sp. J156]MEE1620755.1 thiamine-phosphate kinase [Zafaria sp. J156]